MVSESVSWPVSMMIGALKMFSAQNAHGFATVDVGQADIHDDQIDLSRLGGLHAPAAVLRRDRFILLVQRNLLRQRVAQFGIIVDNENFASRIFVINCDLHATRTHAISCDGPLRARRAAHGSLRR